MALASPVSAQLGKLAPSWFSVETVGKGVTVVNGWGRGAARPSVSRLSWLVVFILMLPPTAGAQGIFRVHAHMDLGPFPAIHGVNGGPLVRREWRPTSNQQTIDMTRQFAAAAIPESRTHDDGSTDMQRLWLPRDDTGLVFSGMDPRDDANWSPDGMAALDERLTAAEAAGVRNYLRCGHGRLELFWNISMPASWPSCAPAGIPEPKGSRPQKLEQ